MANEPMDPETRKKLAALKKRRGLGRGLGEILEEQEPSEVLGKTLFADTSEPFTNTADPDGELTITWDKLYPQYFNMINIVETTTYYQGPNRSSRVRRFKFSTDAPVTINNQKALETGTLEGVVIVEFIKKATICEYGPMPIKDFIEFKDSVSLGQAVTEILEPHTFRYV